MKIVIPKFGDIIDSRIDHKSLIEVKTPEKTLNLILSHLLYDLFMYIVGSDVIYKWKTGVIEDDFDPH